jgi:predicted methyltransferase
MRIVSRSSYLAVSTIVSTAIAVAPSQARSQASDIFARRDEWQRTSDIIAALGDVRGKHIADIAAGTGYLTKALSRAVGPSGRVFAVEIGEKELAALRQLAEQDSFPNVTVVAATETDPRLPDPIDGAVILNSYHEIAQYARVLDALHRKLRRATALILVDNSPVESWKSETRTFQVSHHSIDPAIVVREVTAAGFEIARRADDFITSPLQQWLIAARRP